MASLKQHELDVLKNYIPESAVEDVLNYMHTYKIHLKIKRERKGILGDYRPAMHGKPHTISINGTLNPYQFLITFIHEVAHLLTFLQFGHRVKAHGEEWKKMYSHLLQRFLEKKIFPEVIEKAIIQSIKRPGASTCSEPHLFKVLRQYDEPNGKVLVDHLEIGDCFRTEKQGHFRILEKRRTRYLCEEIQSRKKFLFPGLYEVYKI